jgi:hypothetical protein
MKITWINSGITPDALTFAVYDGLESLVGSGTMTASGNGHYFGYSTLPGSAGFYTTETTAEIGGYPFIRRQKVRAVIEDVD